ncbi:MAG TPA: aldehyde dehydrogenase family protein [Polyangiaceae bacterium]|jgi:acyl-CoA reductase-like NAD-dependent aldehyde dehydrogenase|nr:aldehyde dehydrogenase family protein [Polyangiaceae bacterium]
MTLPVYRTFDRKQFAEVPTHSDAELEQKLARAAKAFGDRDRWRKPHDRVAILQRLATLVDAKKDEFAALMANEGGKPYPDALVEATRAVDGIRDGAEELRNFAGQEIPMGLSAATDGRWAFTVREPIGVVAAISAFNHPLNLIVHQVVPAIAVGCPVIVKPAGTTPLSCLRFIELVREAGLEPEWCDAFVPVDNAGAEKLATDPRVAFLSFIGSARVGWSLRAKLAPGARCALEHGGAAPCIVDEAADLDGLITPMVKGGYYHAGQVCVSTQRIYVHETVFDDFAARFTASVAKLRVADPSLKDTEVGPLILPREVERVGRWVDEAVAGGAKLAVGGKRASETTYEPTVLVEPPADAKVSREEVFGPVTCLYRYQKLDDAIARANDVPVAFQASVFTKNLDVALRVADRIAASTVLINDHTAFRADWMPFAGRKQSGLGIGGIPWTMHEMSEHKLVVFKR